jgi:hypothetical protein
VTREFKPAWIFFLVVAGIALVIALLRTSEELQPEVVGAFVAIQPESEDAARVGRVDISAGTPFRLHAVVEAMDWRGRRLFYTEAPALELPDGPVADEQLRPWDRGEKVRVLWFTVEGSPPYAEIESLQELESPRYREVFQSDWPQAWSVPGRLEPAVENFLPGHDQREMESRFGSQRFHVRVELFSSMSNLLPVARLRSPGATDLQLDASSFPGVSATLDWPLLSLSRFFGLPQLEPATEAPPEVSAALAELTASGLSFNRLEVLRRWLDEVKAAWDGLEWRPVELNAEVEWTTGAAIRAGSKVAFAYEDRGVAARLDKSDLCLDFDRGATVRTLGEIFVGEGLVEIAPVAPLVDE